MAKRTFWKRYGKRLAERDGMTCHWCGTWVEDQKTLSRPYWRESKHGGYTIPGEVWGFVLCHTATVDHIIPKSRGGTNDLDNLVIACYPCNTGRGAARKNWKKAEVTYGQCAEKFNE